MLQLQPSLSGPATFSRTFWAPRRISPRYVSESDHDEAGTLHSVLGNYLAESCGRTSLAVGTLKGSGIDRNPLATFGTTISNSTGTARDTYLQHATPGAEGTELAAGTDRTARCDDATLRTRVANRMSTARLDILCTARRPQQSGILKHPTEFSYP
jgi:hypothetical protein